VSQKLSDLIQRFPWMEFPPAKTKHEVRRDASRKAAKRIKRVKAVRAMVEAEKRRRGAA
jgi:hypothetical protein